MVPVNVVSGFSRRIGADEATAPSGRLLRTPAPGERRAARNPSSEGEDRFARMDQTLTAEMSHSRWGCLSGKRSQGKRA
jgi:hypothetical protein